ncbi:MAG: HPr family phosphocarrier protein [Candidatus Desulfofervidus sp.]|nr:HPr family phosphocarrier protein [Candidatus Desulfofervidus sp.]
MVGYFRVQNKLGLHARPAAKLANLARSLNAEISIIKNNKKADAKSIIDLLALSCQFNDELKVEITGKEAHKAFWLLCQLFETEIGERINGTKI